MLGLAGVPLGVRCRFLDPSANAPAAALGDVVAAGLADPAGLDAVASRADVVTYEWEGVPAEAVRRLEASLPVRPGSRPLAVAQDRLEEKTAFGRLGIPVAPFTTVDDRAGLDAAIASIGLPAILKARRGGYDGKGQHVLRVRRDTAAAFATVGGDAAVLEQCIPFSRELSIVAARGLDGEIRCYPVVENVHRDGILRTTRAPAGGLGVGLQEQARKIAVRLLDELDYVGVLAVELFEHAGQLLANEFAPRVHNSGHWTIEGAETSQFEQHLRAILGWPLGSPAPRGHAVMVNCIGGLPAREDVLAVPGAHFHSYDKEARPGRKVGHVTIVGDDPTALAERADRIEALVRAVERS
jgi:5-(carboxyamino)imidazole ribonucleotide synthase